VRRTEVATGLLAAVAVLSAGCGSTEQIHRGEIQSQAQAYFDALARKRGEDRFADIKCPDDLEATKGKSTRCTAAGTDGSLGITVTVTQVRDDGVTLAFTPDHKLTK
jgi:hypothetical protein